MDVLARPYVLVLRGTGEELDELLLYLACTAHVYLVGIRKLGSDLFEVLMSKRDLMIVGRVLVRVFLAGPGSTTLPKTTKGDVPGPSLLTMVACC